VRIPAEVRRVVHADGAALKKVLQAEAKGVKHAPGLPAAITFESGVNRGGAYYEVGPVEGGAGSLALLYFGNSRTGARLKDPRFALERQADKTTEAISGLMERLG
jgi:hypothetical protein